MRVIMKDGREEEMKGNNLTVADIKSKREWEDLLFFMDQTGIEAFEDFTLAGVSANSMISRGYVEDQIKNS